LRQSYKALKGADIYGCSLQWQKNKTPKRDRYYNYSLAKILRHSKNQGFFLEKFSQQIPKGSCTFIFIGNIWLRVQSFHL
jgi:hypothetical protein